MNPESIFTPFLLCMLLTLVVWITLFARRIPFIQRNEITPEQMQGSGALAALTPPPWVFVAFRALHSLVHCSFNHVMLRFSLYLVSCLAVWGMLGRSLWAQLGA